MHDAKFFGFADCVKLLEDHSSKNVNKLAPGPGAKKSASAVDLMKVKIFELSIIFEIMVFWF